MIIFTPMFFSRTYLVQSGDKHSSGFVLRGKATEVSLLSAGSQSIFQNDQ